MCCFQLTVGVFLAFLARMYGGDCVEKYAAGYWVVEWKRPFYNNTST